MALSDIFSWAVAKGTSGMTWQQAIDMVCSLLCITERHLIIDSARAVVHLSFKQIGQPREITITFNDIVAAINQPSDLGVESSRNTPAIPPVATSPP